MNDNTTLKRRGFQLGNASEQALAGPPNLSDRWQQGYATRLNGLLDDRLPSVAPEIEKTELLVGALLDDTACEEVLSQTPYKERLATGFESLGTAFNEGDDQEIEMLLFDALQDQDVVAQDLWMKVSWLSFFESDASLRFRFSFGVDFEEDVSADPVRQHYASKLADAVFPESSIVTQHSELNTQLTELLGSEFKYVERIVYFNGPDGGAYLHHDLERGHAGVVYAQLSGSTFWLALPKNALASEIKTFIESIEKHDQWPSSIDAEAQHALLDLALDKTALVTALDSFNHDALIHLINETEAFVQHLVQLGYGFTLQPGDVILLPQSSPETCCWHTVFCLGEEMGQALSFAIRGTD